MNCFVVGIIPHYFSERTLVHICIPQTYTPCGRGHQVGLTWSSCDFSFGVAFPLPCDYIIPHLRVNVNTFLKK